VRREVLGDEHVDAQPGDRAPTELDDAPVPGLHHRRCVGGRLGPARARPPTRSLVTIALLAALGHERELEMHLRASAADRRDAGADRRGAAARRLYAGVPAANTAFAALKRVLGRMRTTPKAERRGDLVSDDAPKAYRRRDDAAFPPYDHPPYRSTSCGTRSSRWCRSSTRSPRSPAPGPRWPR
jgi:4-carboxymuconolactone decarboxylase